MENERKRITPQSRKNPPKTEQEREEREAQNDKLKVKIQEIESRIEKNGGKAQMPEVGWVAAKSALHFFASEGGHAVLKRLAALHIHPKSDAVKVAIKTGSTAPLAGKTLVVTGTLPTMSREEAHEKIRAAGGTASGSVSSKTSYLLAGEEAGSKLEKAQALGVKILTEKEFLDLLGSEVQNYYGWNLPFCIFLKIS